MESPDISSPSLGTGGGSSSSHLTVRTTITKTIDRIVKQLQWEGTWDEIRAKLGEYTPGERITDEDLSGGGSATEGTGKSYAFVTQATANRTVGDGGTLDVTIVQLFLKAIFSIDFCEISKDVRTWKQFPLVDQNKPDLSLIKAWEDSRETDYDSYKAYRVNGETMTGNTLKLAEKIFSGTESYTVHAPVVTCRATYFSLPSGIGEGLDRTGDPTTPASYTFYGGDEDTLQRLIPSGLEWLKTCDRSDTNADGTFTRTIQWTGADAIDLDLYPGATPSS